MDAQWQAELDEEHMGSHAISYVRRGWRVFPVAWPSFPGVCACRRGVECNSPAKHPLVEWGEEATTDEATVRRWWTKWPNANIGLACGGSSKFVVLDLDEKKDGPKWWKEQASLRGMMQPTPVVHTGGGGLHLYWYRSDPMGNRAGVGPGVDVRGDGGYVVAPPSMHESGVRYLWHERFHPGRLRLARIPKWVEELMVGRKPKAHRKEGPPPGGWPDPEPERDIERHPKIAEGGRNDTIFRLACRWRRQEMGDSDLGLWVHEANSKLCHPPLEERELSTIIGSVIQRY